MLQDLAYPDQLALKYRQVQQRLSSLGDLPAFELIGADDPWRYRNKAEFTFGTVDGRMVLGYHAARSYWRVVDLEDCLLMPQPAMRVMRHVLERARDTGLPAYHPNTHQGFFRYAVVRASRATGRLVVCLVTASGRRDVMETLAHGLAAEHQELSGIWWATTDRLADVALPEQLALLAGEGTVEEQVGPFRLTLDPFSFLQPAIAQAEKLYDSLCELLSGLDGAVAWDLYCGIGVIALYLSRRCRRVYAIDAEPRHAELVARHAAANGAANISPWAGRVETLLMDRRFWLGEAKPDVVIVDPPRAGLHAQALSSILAARPKQVAYISCNPQSLARDAAVLKSSFPKYRLAALRAFDMFPQTRHVETLAVFTRSDLN